MALVSRVPAIPQRLSCVITGFMATSTSMGEIVVAEEPNTDVANHTIYVAVAKDVKESYSNLKWAIDNSAANKICILHVHVPPTMIPMMDEQQVEKHRANERQKMHDTLNDYLLICQRMGVRADKLHIEMECIEKGILHLISHNAISKLVMGAASDKTFSRKMTDLKSKKAIYVRQQAPAYCQIQFVCKGNLIYTRHRRLDNANVDVPSPLAQPRPDPQPKHSLDQLRSQSCTMGQNKRVNLISADQELLLRRARSANDGLGVGGNKVTSSPSSSSSSDVSEGFSTPAIRLAAEVSSDESDGISRRSLSVFSTSSASAAVEPTWTPNLISEETENVIHSNELSQVLADFGHLSPLSALDGGMDDTLYDLLKQTMDEAENARRCVYQESCKRAKAEKEAIDAMRRAKASESLYKQVLRERKEAEEALEKEREEVERMKRQQEKVKEELELALDQKSSLESQIASSELMVKELEQKIICSVDLLTNFRKERDELQIQRDNALREAEELRKKQGDASASSTDVPDKISEFSLEEIKQATNNFNSSLKIGEGGYGSIYKGFLGHTEVAIKVLHDNNRSQGASEFQQEVEVLSKLRHPNVIRLIGACPETYTLVYEYLANGSLEDRLKCKDKTAPLSWQTRIRIASELCSALMFLHSSKPHSIVHGDLKPSNILLDANLVSKLSDFGICRILCLWNAEAERSISREFWRTSVPKGTLVYMDPEFLSSGELTPKSDIYSFGIILLRLLTGRPAMGITKEVQYALDSGGLKSLLDPLGGEWPFVQAQHLARLALRCCELNRKNRPDLHSDKVMEDPYIAADGFTYEGEAIRGWLESGRTTSPMTDEKLEHSILVPNHALRSAIQDWIQNHPLPLHIV
ncbi:U-box domain-containing protein 33 isoform X2 [Senna tora]|uniref:RING-type E3 ubiquitin transferase n=1 Tax=Senna tora TaxID=362788 RepID=A0A834TTF8_9FABA|nr:U-box domain-containing protein 33 isoform X2 [Senna tora]